ncbi:MAG: chemotaxis-specific protein-glutamate methyltransferase CheB [Roseiflexaceae bacterium]|nr:chemotaxis-specific protein-glutamate methyltransferase CheB [Roseiflexaceae bacterium]
MNNPIRVVIIDDSALMRRMLTTMLAHDPTIKVVGEARDGHEGIRVVESLRPDLVTMDVLMPGLDGLATTEHLMAYCPTPILVLTGSLTSGEVDITFKMLGAGALEVVEKPSGSHPALIERATRDLIRRIKILSRVKVVTHLRGRRRLNEAGRQAHIAPNQPVVIEPENRLRPIPDEFAVVRQSIAKPTQFPLIVMGASTGGPRVIHRILTDLPADLPAAVLIVQHIAEGFSTGMVEWLQGASALPVVLATEGLPIRPGIVLVAPDQRDIMITNERTIHLTKSPLLIQRPSIDIAMQAAAEIFAADAIGVLLTGMGRDGAFGLLAIRRCGGHTIAQDEQSCAIFGMPKAAMQLVAVDEVLPPTHIAVRLVDLVRHRVGTAVRASGGSR